jgi:hypothetical protein
MLGNNHVTRRDTQLQMHNLCQAATIITTQA